MGRKLIQKYFWNFIVYFQAAKTSADAAGDILIGVPGFIGGLLSFSITHPYPGDPAQWNTTWPQLSTLATLSVRNSSHVLQPSWGFLWRFACIVYGSSTPHSINAQQIKAELQNLRSLFLLWHILLSNPACRASQTSPCAWKDSSQKPLPGGLSKGLYAPTGQLLWWTLTRTSLLVFRRSGN